MNGSDIGAKHLSDIGYNAKIVAHGIAGGLMVNSEGGKFGGK